MTRTEFERIARAAEAAAEAGPTTYRLRVALLAALGYGLVWFLLLGAVGVVMAVGAAVYFGQLRGATVRLLELGIPAIILAGIILKALWIRIEPPQGIRLQRSEFPHLFDAIEDVRHRLRGPKVHVVLLNDEFNASISQIPRLGIFGWHRNYLVLGLPLLHALSTAETLAVLGHEYGHLSGSHGKFGAWIYRVRKTWYQLMEALHQRGGAIGALPSAFFDWYAPYFDAYSFTLARSNEYEADRAAAAAAGLEHLGAALVRIDLSARFLESDFWPSVYRAVEQSPTPDARPHAQLATGLLAATPMDGSATHFEHAMRRRTDMADTHPCLADRLGALGLAGSVPAAPKESAARAFLDTRVEELTARLDERWRDANAGPWRERHEQVRFARNRLAELAQVDERSRSVDALLEQARLTEELDGLAAAIPFYRGIVDRQPGHALARYRLATAKLVEGDPEGVIQIESAVADDVALQVDGYLGLSDHFWNHGDTDRANTYHDRAVAAMRMVERIQAERSTIQFEAVYDPPDLSPEHRAQLVARLRADPFVKRAWVVKKRLKLSTEPVYVVGVVGATRLTVKDEAAAVAQRIASALDLPIEIYVVVAEGKNRPLLKDIELVPDSRLI